MDAIQAVHMTTTHRDVEDFPWVSGGPGLMRRIIHASVEDSLSVTQLRAEPFWTSGLHLHAGTTMGWTTSGAWSHVPDDYNYKPGTYVFEAVNELHRFRNGPGITEAIFMTIGPVDYYDDEGTTMIGRDDAAAKLRSYLEGCEAAGLPRPNVLV